MLPGGSQALGFQALKIKKKSTTFVVLLEWVTRLVCIPALAEIEVRLGPALTANCLPDSWISSFEPYCRKMKSRRFRVGLERVTRLELATSTLARWRSTG